MNPVIIGAAATVLFVDYLLRQRFKHTTSLPLTGITELASRVSNGKSLDSDS